MISIQIECFYYIFDETPHAIAVRIYQGEYLVQQAKTIAGKKFTLLNLPFYWCIESRGN